MVVMVLQLGATALGSIGLGLGSGFAFGTGYGAGVRFGYEDVYPYLKSNMSAIANILQIPFASSGFKLASGVTQAQGMGLGSPTQSGSTTMGLSAPAPSATATRSTGLTQPEMLQLMKILPPGGTPLAIQKHGSKIIVSRTGADYISMPGTLLYNRLSSFI